jgi:DNA-binding LacI/PurR family transcriptional regulator
VLEVLDRTGVRVPEDISVVGYDNTHIAGIYRYDLTTVDQPRREMGRAAMALLLERIRGERDVARHVVLPPSLVARGSTAPPPT